MKKGIFVFTLALGASCHVLADTAESCPSVTAIEKNGDTYMAMTSDGEGTWLGIGLDDDGGITKFSSAKFDPAMDSGSRAAVSCSYELGDGDYADLEFLPRRPEPDLSVDVSTWRQKHDPYGPSYYECTAQSALDCSFDVIRRP
ncbi:DUF3757 domain-containing protein [Paraburkholderia sp. EG304]|uniref:DUF3757 domain-containing protein n=1 Tax=Paraburkholderia sp. EG304 TaxID=3237015 RepID=UPI00397E8018